LRVEIGGQKKEKRERKKKRRKKSPKSGKNFQGTFEVMDEEDGKRSVCVWGHGQGSKKKERKEKKRKEKKRKKREERRK
jgi:hypothetical protein